MQISDTIKSLRTKAEYTQNQLAEKLNCNRQKIADWERGKSLPAADDLVLLSRVFHVSTDYLLGLAVEPTQDLTLNAVCEYTGLNKNTVYDLNRSTSRTLINYIDYLVSKFEGFDIATVFSDYLRLFSEMRKKQSEMIELIPQLPLEPDIADNMVEQYKAIIEKMEWLQYIIQKRNEKLLSEYAAKINKEIDEDSFDTVFLYLSCYNSLGYLMGRDKNNKIVNLKELKSEIQLLKSGAKEISEQVIDDFERKEREHNGNDQQA